MNRERELILTRMEASERTEAYQTEKRLAVRDLVPQVVAEAVIVAASLIANHILSVLSGCSESEYWFATGMILGLGMVSVVYSGLWAERRYMMFAPPTAEEMNELGDRII